MHRSRAGGLLMACGLVLMAAALCLAGWNQWEQYRAEQTARAALDALDLPAAAPSGEKTSGQADDLPAYLLDPQRPMPEVTADGRRYIGRLDIPALDRSLPVQSQWSDEDLKASPCRYGGSAYLDDLILAGHNYKSHFGGLGRLQPGDSVVFTDMDGSRFDYVVAGVEWLEGGDIEGMTAGDWDLTLFTCTASRRERVTVRCVRCDPQ